MAPSKTSTGRRRGWWCILATLLTGLTPQALRAQDFNACAASPEVKAAPGPTARGSRARSDRQGIQRAKARADSGARESISSRFLCRAGVQNWVVDAQGVVHLKGIGYDSTEKWEQGMTDAIENNKPEGEAASAAPSPGQ